MKKVFLMVCAMATLVAGVACAGNTAEGKCEKKCEKKCCVSDEERGKCCELRAKWAKFDDLTAEEQAALIAERKAKIDERIAHFEARKAEMEAKRAEREAKCAELKAKWEKFDELTSAEQKALIDELDACRRHHCHHKCAKACNHEGKKCCKHHCHKGEKSCKKACHKPCPKAEAAE